MSRFYATLYVSDANGTASRQFRVDNAPQGGGAMRVRLSEVKVEKAKQDKEPKK